MYNNATTTCQLFVFIALETSYNIEEIVVSILRNTVVVLLRCCYRQSIGNSGRETLYKLILLSVLYRDDIGISARFYSR